MAGWKEDAREVLSPRAEGVGSSKRQEGRGEILKVGLSDFAFPSDPRQNRLRRTTETLKNVKKTKPGQRIQDEIP